MSLTVTECPLCGGLAAIQGEWIRTVPAADAFVEGFSLGVLIERAARHNDRHVSNLVCSEHLQVLRRLADKIPLEVIGPSHRHLLNLGLQVVKVPG